MELRIGQIPYLNSVLFYHGLGGDAAARAGTLDIELLPLVPRQLSGAVLEDVVDAGPVPTVTCWDIEKRYEPLGGFCIATRSTAHSILLFSKVPFEELGGARVGVTVETSTSVRLMKVLLANVWRVRPREYVRLDWPRNDAFLLIGDEALLHGRGVDGYPHVADLGDVWHDWTGLPFVFAQWMVRRDLDAAVKEALAGAVGRSLDAGWKDFDNIVAPHARRLSMSASEIRTYLEAFHFRMNDKTRSAVDRFRQLDAESAGAGAASTVES
jgi:chorismate dehydratase